MHFHVISNPRDFFFCESYNGISFLLSTIQKYKVSKIWVIFFHSAKMH